MSEFPHSALEEYRTQASLLLKQLRSADSHISKNAGTRFQQHPSFEMLSVDEILDSSEVKRKHALHILALEHGFDSWVAFKTRLERQDRLHNFRQVNRYTLLYQPQCVGFINEWHVDYEVASQELGRNGGYLLPYKNQFFICQDVYIEALGLDPDDPDWALIGWNWVKPADQEAWARLEHKLRDASGAK